MQTQIDANHTDLYGKLNKEITDRQVEASELRTSIITETSERKNADQIIEHSIDDLNDKVEGYHTSETESIAQEKAAREADVAALEDKKVTDSGLVIHTIVTAGWKVTSQRYVSGTRC